MNEEAADAGPETPRVRRQVTGGETIGDCLTAIERLESVLLTVVERISEQDEKLMALAERNEIAHDATRAEQRQAHQDVAVSILDLDTKLDRLEALANGTATHVAYLEQKERSR